MIRAYKANDRKGVFDIYAQCKLDELQWEQSSFTFVPLDLDERRYKLFIQSTVFDYENADGDLVGFCAYKKNHIGWLFVLSEYRGKGIGQALIKHALEKLEGQGSLYVVKSNKPALNLYEKLGFKYNNDLVGDYQGTPVDIIKMVYGSR